MKLGRQKLVKPIVVGIISRYEYKNIKVNFNLAYLIK